MLIERHNLARRLSRLTGHRRPDSRLQKHAKALVASDIGKRRPRNGRCREIQQQIGLVEANHLNGTSRGWH